MANIGRVYRDSYKKDGKDIPLITLDIRTITVRKKFTISVNKNKYPSGVVDGVVAQEVQNHPDYHIWTNLSNRGESLPSVIVGNIKNEVSENGLAYKRAKIFDPFISKENIYFTLFSVDDDKKIDANHLYNVVAQPYRKMHNHTDEYQTAQPSYEANTSQQTQTYAKADGGSIPVENIDIPDDEIPY